jgi:hypothetical protein
MIELSYKDGEAPLITEGKKMNATAITEKVKQAVTMVIIEGECEVPVDNKFGGVDVWLDGQAGYITEKCLGQTETYFAEGVRISVEYETITVIKFEHKAMDASHFTLRGDVSAELLAGIIEGLL